MAKVKESEKVPKTFRDGVTNFASKKKNILKYLLFITVYALLGALVYVLWFENVTFIDALYFTSITISTVGYGDIVPTTTAQKIYTSFYVLIGVIFILGVFVTLLVNDLFESVAKVRQNHEEAREDHVLDKVEEKEKVKALPVLETRLRAYGRVAREKLPLIIASFVPSIIFTIVEGWQWVEIIYYTIVTATTRK